MRRDSTRTWLLRGVGAALLAGTFGYLPYHLYSRSGFAEYMQLRRMLDDVRAQNARQSAENDAVARYVEALRSDPRTLEREVRQRARWVKPGEVLFDLGAPDTQGGGRP